MSVRLGQALRVIALEASNAGRDGRRPGIGTHARTKTYSPFRLDLRKNVDKIVNAMSF